jgi:PAT family beta-lactamase induction signal transducer AmpG
MAFIKIFKDYRLFEVFVLGIISGMPLAIIFFTIAIWLKESGIDIAVITTIAVARLPYSLKIFWAPFVDQFKIPILSKFGHRKSWLILCSAGTALVLFAMSKVSPTISLAPLYVLAILLGILSATFDISVDALRIEKFDQQTQAIGGSSAVLGYRIGMLITNAGALYFAEITDSWPQTFLAMSGLFIVAIIFIMTVKEGEQPKEKLSGFTIKSINQMVINPLKDFLTRDGAVIILITVILFKLGDAIFGAVSGPFYIELGYTKGQIALVTKVYGLIATILGSIAGGVVMYKLGNFKGLIITGIAQSITHLTFVWLNHQEADFSALLVAITIENFACGMGSAALLGYLSILCNKKYTATQYALLSSCSTLCNNTLTMYSGSLKNMLGWDNFFIFTIFLAVPSIILLVYLDRRFTKTVAL